MAASGLPDDWRPPARVRLEEAWDKHAHRDTLDQLKRERDQSGDPTWQLVRELHEDKWVEYWMRPVDPFDERQRICVGRWAEKVETDPLKDAQAIVEEHDP